MPYQCFDRYTGVESLRALCQPQVDFGTYSECDDGTVRLRWDEYSENTMLQVFDTETGDPLYARANGYLSPNCDTDEGDTSFVAGEQPGDATCSLCTFCYNGQAHLGEGGAAGAQPDDLCSF
jgi:hypothetical protein